MLRTQGPGVQAHRDLWLNVSVLACNTTVSISTRVIPHYAMFGRKVMLPLDWVFPKPSAEKRMMYQWTGDMKEERQHRIFEPDV